MKWKILSQALIFDNGFYKIKQDRCQKSNGEIVEKYYTIIRNNIVVIAAFTKERELILVDQYRHPVLANDLELPAGYIEETEDAYTAAKRELLEETGYSSNQLVKIAETYASAGTMNNKIFFFLAQNAEKIAEPNLDLNEEMVALKITWNNAIKALENGEIQDTASVTGILLAKKYLKENGYIK